MFQIRKTRKVIKVFRGQSLESVNFLSNFFPEERDASNMTLKTLKATTRINYNGHESCFDVVFSNCERSKSGKVYNTVSDHEMVFAVIGDDLAKRNAEIKDYRKLEKPESSVAAVFYMQNLSQTEYLNSFSQDQKLDFLTNCLVHTIHKYSPLITRKNKSKQDW